MDNRIEDLGLCYEKISKLANSLNDKKLKKELNGFAELYKQELFDLYYEKNKEFNSQEAKELKVKGGGYNIMGTMLFFDTNKGKIAMDLKSALEVASALVDCVGLDYKTNTMQQVEEEIAEREEIR